jgi:type II secretory pathway component PulM
VKRLNINLARREKIIVASGISFVALFLIWQFGISPALSVKTRLQKSIQLDKKRIEELMLLSSEFKTLQGSSGGVGKALTKRGKGFTLFSLLEQVASRVGLKDSIKYIKPSTTQTKGKFKISSVELQFERITMRQLFDYLYRIEDPKNILKIRRISIKKHKEKPGYVDATLQVSTVQPV